MNQPDKIKTVRELEQELIGDAETDEVRNIRLFSLALATLLSEICPQDRTMLRVDKNAYG